MTQPERSALSDARMADAAIALICERGAAATTLKDVGLRAGYSRGLASYRFGSKEGLWAFLIHTIGEEWLAELQQVVAGTTGLRDDPRCRRRALPLPAGVLGPNPRVLRAVVRIGRSGPVAAYGDRRGACATPA